MNWSEFSPTQGEGLENSSLQELQASVGFTFVLPSCSPYPLSKDFLLSTQSVSNENQAGLFLYPEDTSLDPRIRITEAQAASKLPEAIPTDADTETISGTTVTSTTFPSPGDTSAVGTMLRYHWVKDDVDFEVEFIWRPPGPAEVTSDMKRQADEVIGSMILEADHP